MKAKGGREGDEVQDAIPLAIYLSQESKLRVHKTRRVSDELSDDLSVTSDELHRAKR
jgi:hypothetical protein